MTYRKRVREKDVNPLEEFMETFGMSPGEAGTAFRDPNAPLLKILRHLRVKTLEDLVNEQDLTPHGYRQQGAIRLIDTLLSIPDMLKELS